jgi:PAS domain S-box-containing protein
MCAPFPWSRDDLAPKSPRLSDAESAQWFFDHSHDLFAVVSRGRLATVNPAWTRVTGWTRQDLIGQPALRFVHPDSRQDFIETAALVRASGEAVNRLKVICKTGGWVWLEGRSRLGPNGEMIGALRDVTADMARRAEIAAARQTRDLLASSAGIGVWSYEPHGQHIEWSRDIFTATGLEPEDVAQPDQFFARLDPHERETLRAAFDRPCAPARAARSSTGCAGPATSGSPIAPPSAPSRAPTACSP